jgi:cytochrome c-type biogenesis protein
LLDALFADVRCHFPLVIAAGGGILVVMGFLIWTGEPFALNIQAQGLMDRVGLDFLTSV